MIVEIETPKDNCRHALEYNENKVLGGGAFLVGYANLDSTDRDRIYEVFERYENSLYPTVQKSFHASVNPSGEDTCTEEQVLDFVAALMDHLGYGRQPILVYRHNDVDREHYHVVSVRIDAEGRKIKNLYERRVMKDFLRKVGPRYGISAVEKGQNTIRNKTSLEEGDNGTKAKRFTSKSDAAAQLKDLYTVALGYDCDGFPQFQAVLEDLGVKAALKAEDEGHSVVLQGIDRKGRTISQPFTGEMLGLDLYEEFQSTQTDRRARHSRKSREKGRLRNLVGFAFEVSKSEGHFCNILAEKGIHVHFSRKEDSGEIFGITFVDHTTRTVFKASEIRDVISVSMVRDAVISGKWRLERPQSHKSSTKRSRQEARADAIALRNRQSGVMAHLLTPAGGHSGSSWSGKSQQTPEQRQEERDSQKQGALNASLVDTRYIEKIH